MEVLTRKQDNFDVIDLKGEFDFLTAQEVKEQILAILDSGINRLIINFSELKYIDSTGLGILINLWTKARERKINLKYTNMTGSVEKVVNLSRLNLFLPIVNTIEEAIIQLQKPIS